MPTLTFHKAINAGPEVVFQILTNMEKYPEVVSGITNIDVLTDGPVGLGTKFKETRVVFGREANEVMEFTEFEPPNRYVLEANSHGSHYRTVHEIKPNATGGTDLTLEFIATPVNIIAKVMSVVMMPLFKKAMVRCLEQDLEDVKNHAEGKNVLDPA